MLKLFGKMEVISDGKKVIWVWDYANDKPRIKSEMTKEEILVSNKARKIQQP